MKDLLDGLFTSGNRRSFIKRVSGQILVVSMALLGVTRVAKADCGIPVGCCNLCAEPGGGCDCSNDPTACSWTWNCGDENGNWACTECIAYGHSQPCDGTCAMCDDPGFLCSGITQIP